MNCVRSKVGKYTPRDVNACKNRICFCVEYLNFSSPQEYYLYTECFQLNRKNRNMFESLVSPQMIKYLFH